MPIPINLIEALRLGTPLAAEVPASEPERLAGVVIVPKRELLDQRARKEGWKARISDRKYRLFWREYSRRHIEHNWDIVPGDGMWEIRRAEVVDEDALEHMLNEWGVPLDTLTYLWKTDIPE
jgi:hypothetical protein